MKHIEKFLIAAAIAAVTACSSIGAAEAATSRHHLHRHAAMRAGSAKNLGRDSFGMVAPAAGRIDTNSPALNGGGSTGYNMKLGIY